MVLCLSVLDTPALHSNQASMACMRDTSGESVMMIRFLLVCLSARVFICRIWFLARATSWFITFGPAQRLARWTHIASQTHTYTETCSFDSDRQSTHMCMYVCVTTYLFVQEIVYVQIWGIIIHVRMKRIAISIFKEAKCKRKKRRESFPTALI